MVHFLTLHGAYDQNVTDGGTEHVEDKGGNETENLNIDKGSEHGPGGDHESDINYFFLDSDYDLDEEDDALFDQNVDEEIEWTGTRKAESQWTRWKLILPCDQRLYLTLRVRIWHLQMGLEARKVHLMKNIGGPKV